MKATLYFPPILHSNPSVLINSMAYLSQASGLAAVHLTFALFARRSLRDLFYWLSAWCSDAGHARVRKTVVTMHFPDGIRFMDRSGHFKRVRSDQSGLYDEMHGLLCDWTLPWSIQYRNEIITPDHVTAFMESLVP